MEKNFIYFFGNFEKTLLIVLNVLLALAVFAYCECRIKHYNTILPAKIKVKYIYTLFISVGIIFSSISYMFFSPIMAFSLGLLLVCVLIRIAYSISWKLCLFFANDFLIIPLLAGGIVPSLLSIVLHLDFNNTPDLIMAIESILAFYLSAVIAHYLNVKKIHVEHWSRFLKHTQYLKGVLYLQIYIYVILVIATIFYDMDVSIWFCWIIILTFTGILIAYEMVLDYTVRGSAVLMYQARVGAYEEQLKYQIQNYDKQIQYISTMRKLKHDFKSFSKVMNELLKSGDVAEASLLLKQAILEGEETFHIYREFSNKPLIQAILNNAYLEAMKKNINFEAEIIAPDTVQVEEFDLCRILNNLIDNALEACESSRHKKCSIFIKGQLHKNWFIVEISNTFNGIINLQADKIQSSKESKVDHGMGLQIVQETLNTYKGFMNVSWENEIFTAKIHIPCTNSSE